MTAPDLAHRLGALRLGMHRLGALTTAEEALRETPRVVCSIGFDRAFVSSVRDGVWLPEAVCVQGDDEWAAEILAAGRASPQRLEPQLIETSLLHRPRTLRVDHVQEAPRVHRAIADASKSTSYLVSPLVRDGEVVGFLHCDRYYSQRDFDDTDLELLATLAEGFLLVLERIETGERMRQIRDLADIGGPWRIGARGGEEIVTRGAGVADALLATAPMTGREREVSRLLAAGLDNRAIAARLAISEDTVKTHVKHVYRKLGATSRAEAVAIWLGAVGEEIPRGGQRIPPSR